MTDNKQTLILANLQHFFGFLGLSSNICAITLQYIEKEKGKKVYVSIERHEAQS